MTRAQATKMGDPSFAGKVMLTLRPNGRYAMSDRKGTANGLYSAAPGNRLVFARDDNCDPDLKGKGLYGWKIEGKVLRITALVAETGGCTGRSILLTLPTWTRG